MIAVKPKLGQLLRIWSKPASQTAGPSGDEEQRLLGAAELAKPAAMLLLAILLVIGSAMLVIYSAYEYRRLFNQHQVLSSQGEDLQVEWGQLLLEESAWSSNNRIETLADKKLQMTSPERKNIEIVRHER
ncbi:cell division protein FtsL [Marinobacterium lutimaris]|uniref:Cell division protein FtsL n=1 Tax=Marinobacterium lutimaris TaxID=568106 RepID=A0A1H6CCT5_9GAMM|nr:cell division protein FtsL [Marinobacterium lutimaris]SEG70830.1 cell division protein FtsL [Marinobacterium lutimaris]